MGKWKKKLKKQPRKRWKGIYSCGKIIKSYERKLGCLKTEEENKLKLERKYQKDLRKTLMKIMKKLYQWRKQQE